MAVHAPFDTIQSSAHTAPDGESCADHGNDGGQLDQQGIHSVRVARVPNAGLPGSEAWLYPGHVHSI